jgi:hypothetical protein
MTVRGVEQIMPKADHMSRVQKIAEDGSTAERFVLELNQELQAKRRAVPETADTKQQRVGDSDPHDGSKQDSPKKESDSMVKKHILLDNAAPGRGEHLDVRT